MNYEGHGRSLILPKTYTATVKTGLLTDEHRKHGIMRLYVSTYTSGSITDINIYIPAPNIDVNTLSPIGALDAAHEAAYYKFHPAVPIAATGVYLFTVGPGAPEGMAINGYWPGEYEVEVVMTAGLIKFELDVLWVG